MNKDAFSRDEWESITGEDCSPEVEAMNERFRLADLRDGMNPAQVNEIRCPRCERFLRWWWEDPRECKECLKEENEDE